MMETYEQRVRESIKDCKSIEEIIDKLEDWEWPIQMKDSWGEADYKKIDILEKIREEERKKRENK